MGNVTITNDGATIMKTIEVMHPAAKMLVDLSQAQVRAVPCRAVAFCHPILLPRAPNGYAIITDAVRCLCAARVIVTPRSPPRSPVQPCSRDTNQQDVEAGDGTTSVVVLCGALLTACEKLLRMGLHPTQISEAFGTLLPHLLFLSLPAAIGTHTINHACAFSSKVQALSPGWRYASPHCTMGLTSPCRVRV
jgi:hypothetical protein